MTQAGPIPHKHQLNASDRPGNTISKVRCLCFGRKPLELNDGRWRINTEQRGAIPVV